MDGVFVAAHIRAAQTVREIDLQARIGFCAESALGPAGGYDWYQLASRLDYLSVPNDPTIVEIAGQAAHDRSVLLLRCDAPMDETTASWMPWYVAMKGLRGIELTHAYATTTRPETAGLSPFGEAEPWLDALSASARALQAGTAELLRAAERVDDGIIVVTSQASRYIRARLHADAGDDALSAFCGALGTLGYGFALAPDNALDAMELEGARAIVLPDTTALSNGGLETLDKFRSNGGLIIASGEAGRYDEHGAERTTGTSEFDPATPDTIGELLASREILPSGHDTIDCDEDFRGIRSHSQYGAAQIYAFLQDAAEGTRASRVRAQAPEGWFVHAPMSEVPPTSRRKETLTITRGGAGMAVMLPYEVSRVQIEAPEGVEAGKRLEVRLSIRTLDTLPGAHLVQVSLRPVSGAPIAHYEQTVECPGGQGATYIPIALNERVGMYEVVARDLLTGLSTIQPVRVNARELNF